MNNSFDSNPKLNISARGRRLGVGSVESSTILAMKKAKIYGAAGATARGRRKLMLFARPSNIFLNPLQLAAQVEVMQRPREPNL